jgi:uncharacterized RDD family membrane protein YckC
MRFIFNKNKKNKTLEPAILGSMFVGTGNIGITIAHPIRRFISFLIDLIIASPILWFSANVYTRMVLYKITSLDNLAWYDSSSTVFASSPFAVLGIVFVMMTTFCAYRYLGGVIYGKTLGMKIVNLRYISSDLKKPTWLRMFSRELLAIISMGIGGGGYIWMIFDESNRGWHDKISKIYMVVGE